MIEIHHMAFMWTGCSNWVNKVWRVMKKKTVNDEEFNFGKNAVTKRRKTFTLAALRKQMEILQGLNIDFQAAIRVAETHSITEVMVDGATKFDRAFLDLVTYITNVRMGIARITLGGSTPDQIAKAAAVRRETKRK